MFTMGPVYTWDHDPKYSVAGQGTRREAQKGVGSYCMPIQEGEVGVPAHPV